MILIDPPRWPAHGRVWGHLVSDVSYAELHAFAAAHGVPRRGFERDHYDVPAEAYAALVAAGALPVDSRELLARLIDAGLRRRKVAAMAPRALGNALLRPPRLRRGDLVSIVAPAGPVPPDRLAAGVARLESWGLRVRVEPHTLHQQASGYLAGGDAERAADFTTGWLDDDVAMVMLARGGYGVQRMLDLLDWRRLAEGAPKVLAGFSDITALHQAVASRLGLVTVHGHVATSLGSATDDSAQRLRRMLFSPEAGDLLTGADPAETLVPGAATGVLVGGNLSLLAAGVGAPGMRSAQGGIVLLEDVSEAPYRIDRMLTQLLRAGWFRGVRGVVAGAFTDCGPPEDVRAVLLDRLGGLGVPVVGGVDIGHTRSTLTVPLGVRARLDAPDTSAEAPALILCEPPLR